jgi:hypothetical protein
VTTAGSVLPAARASRDGKVWLFGAAPDILLGAGLGYLLSVPLLLFVAPSLGLEAWPFWAVAAVVCLASAPHYGATVLRVYERAEERRRYAFFSVWYTLALFAATAAAFRVPWVGSLLVTAFVTWAPWHFAGQNYGVALMFLRRSGVDVQPAKRLLYVSFLLSFVLAFLAIHVEASQAAYTVPTSVAVDSFGLFRLGIPRGIAIQLFAVLALVYLAVSVAAVWRLRGGASLAALAPAILLMCTQALWFSVPAWLDLQGLREAPGLVFATMWINAGHSLQYLWVTSYYDRALRPSRATPLYLAKVTLVGNAVVVLPGLVFAPWLLGNVAWDRGLALLMAGVVNLHHYALDGAIWKLRDGRVARALLRDAQGPGPVAEPASAGGRRVRRLGAAAAVGALGVACLWVHSEELRWQFALLDGRTEQTRAVMDRLAWVGRDHSGVRLLLGRSLARSGRLEEALAEFETSLALAPTAGAWRSRGKLLERLGDASGAAASYRAGLALQPGHRALRKDLARLESAGGAGTSEADG